MKVLVNKKNKIDSVKIICPHCGSEMLREENDETYQTIDGKGFDCPCCNKFIVINKCSPIDFPEAFYHFGQSDKAVKLSNEEIKNLTLQGLDYLNKNKNDDSDWVWYVSTGDTGIVIFRYSDEYTIHVYKNYWSTDMDYNTVEEVLRKYMS